ncbi:MAG: OmpA family protein [Bernardetiaceae bacterium]
MNFLSFLLVVTLSLFSFSGGHPPEERVEKSADGRFTIGYQDHPLLFGYPHRYSSSHFILQAGARLASNSPDFYQTQHLLGERITRAKIVGLETEVGSRYIETHFSFAQLSIKQKLIPVDAQLQPVPLGKDGTYYRIEYEITNNADRRIPVGLSLMLDAKIEDKDNCVATGDGQLVMLDEVFAYPAIPRKVVFHHDHTNPTAAQAIVLTQETEDSHPMDALCVGQWAYLSNIFRLDTSEGVMQYTDDSAVLMEWKPSDLPPKQTRRYVVHLGGPSGKALNAQAHTPKKTQSLEVFFEVNSANVSEESKKEIENFIKANHYAGLSAFLEGYADATGDVQQNLHLAADRIDAVSFVLQMLGLKYDHILTKAHGEFFANEADTRPSTTTKDRKVRITIWR